MNGLAIPACRPKRGLCVEGSRSYSKLRAGRNDESGKPWENPIIVCLICFLFWGGSRGRSVVLGLILFGLSILFLGHFYEERADRDHRKIINGLANDLG
jgi:hypothetical protein